VSGGTYSRVGNVVGGRGGGGVAGWRAAAGEQVCWSKVRSATATQRGIVKQELKQELRLHCSSPLAAEKAPNAMCCAVSWVDMRASFLSPRSESNGPFDPLVSVDRRVRLLHLLHPEPGWLHVPL
jgi:hypothetical protein